jgi:hypothetical protein
MQQQVQGPAAKVGRLASEAAAAASRGAARAQELLLTGQAGLGGSGSSTMVVMTTAAAALRCGRRSSGQVGLQVLWWLQLWWQWRMGAYGGNLMSCSKKRCCQADVWR